MNPERPNKIISEWGVKNDVEVIDLLPAFREAGRKDPYLYYPLNRHWTKNGHRIVAEVIFRELK